MPAQIDVAIILLDKVFKLVSLGIRFEQVYGQIKAMREEGAEEGEINTWLSEQMEKSYKEAQAKIDLMP